MEFILVRDRTLIHRVPCAVWSRRVDQDNVFDESVVTFDLAIQERFGAHLWHRSMQVNTPCSRYTSSLIVEVVCRFLADFCVTRDLEQVWYDRLEASLEQSDLQSLDVGCVR